MKHKVAELDGALLDAAVAMADGRLFEVMPDEWGEPAAYLVLMVNLREFRLPVVGDKVKFCPSTDWRLGGPIIEREGIGIEQDSLEPTWYADFAHAPRADGVQRSSAKGRTPLIAAMRAFVASKFGEEVELP